MYDRVLVPVDGSQAADRAAAAGLSLADRFGAEVALVTVVESGLLDLTTDGDEDEQLREEGRALLADAVADAENCGLAVTSTILEGNPAERIAAYAGEWGADLVAMGRQGRTGLGERLLGSVTERVLHWSDAPVFVVPEDGDPVDVDFDRVLVPTDGSEGAEAAVDHAGAVASESEAAVDAVYVLDLQAAGGTFSAGGLDQRFVDRLESQGEEALDRVADCFDDVDSALDVSTALVRSSDFSGVAPDIQEYVADHGVDLVVVGSHGQSNLERQLLGSVTSTLLRTTEVPVLVVTRSG